MKSKLLLKLLKKKDFLNFPVFNFDLVPFVKISYRLAFTFLSNLNLPRKVTVIPALCKGYNNEK